MIEYNVSLQPFNTFGIDVKASAFARFSSVEELCAILAENAGKLPLFILGGGSNVLLTKPVEALVLKNEISGFTDLNETQETVDICAGAGEEWHKLVRHCVERGLGGLENLSLIPGSVGASPMQNIGAYGAEIKDCFVSLEAWHIERGELHTFNAEQCAFGYRESVFKRGLKGQYVILSVTYRLQKHPLFNTGYGAISDELTAMGVTELSVGAISQAVMNIRRSKLPDPKELGNAGSFFKNPVVETSFLQELLSQYPDVPHYPQPDGTEKLAAGWLIEKAGWKGKRVGNCGVHAKQALVLVNYGGATGSEIYALSQAVLDAVHGQFGVQLEREVNIL
jgi:UDP-N-acetylmuramate dehydrogenase